MLSPENRELVERVLPGLLETMLGRVFPDDLNRLLDAARSEAKPGDMGSSGGRVQAAPDGATAAPLSAEWEPSPFSTAYDVHDKPMLVMASYCGEDNGECSDRAPCAECLRMSNVALVRGRIKVLGSFGCFIPAESGASGADGRGPPVRRTEAKPSGDMPAAVATACEIVRADAADTMQHSTTRDLGARLMCRVDARKLGLVLAWIDQFATTTKEDDR